MFLQVFVSKSHFQNQILSPSQIGIVLAFPFDLVRQLTIPMFTQETWDRLTASLSPLFAGVFILVTQESID